MNAQPPFLLRYSPLFFARSDAAPAWFVHSKRTNRLSLRQGVQPPWIRPNAPTGEQAVWQYCQGCSDSYFHAGQRTKAHIPYRDKASQHWIRPIRRFRKQAQPRPAAEAAPAAPIPEPPAPDNDADMVQGEPVVGEVESEGEAMEGLPSDAEGGDACEDDDLEDFGAFAARGFVPKSFNLPPDEPPRSLADYKKDWDEKFASHSRDVPGEFGRSNLIPKAVPELWQDCPHVDFDALKTDAAISRLSVCRPYSAIEQASCATGIGRSRALENPFSTSCPHRILSPIACLPSHTRMHVLVRRWLRPCHGQPTFQDEGTAAACWYNPISLR